MPTKSIGVWPMCMVMEAQSIPQWQIDQQNLIVGETL